MAKSKKAAAAKKVNKRQEIVKILRRKPDTKNAVVVEKLAEKGIEVTGNYVSMVRRALKDEAGGEGGAPAETTAKPSRRRGRQRSSVDTITVAQMKQAASFVNQFTSIGEAREAIDALESIRAA